MNRDDDGLTLVEVIVYIVISGLFLGLLAALFANGLSTQEKSSARDSATAYANALAVSLGNVRNASSVIVTPDGATVVAKIVSKEGTERCEAWHVGDERVTHTQSVQPQPTPTQTVAPIAPSGATSWSAISGGQTKVTGAFSAVGRTLSVDLEVTVGGETVNLQTTIAAQAVLESSGVATCTT